MELAGWTERDSKIFLDPRGVPMKRIAFLMLLALACIPDPTPKLVPIPAAEPAGNAWSVAEQRIAKADGVTVGTITKLESDGTYDDPCGLIAKLMHRCDGTVTYRLLVEPAHKWLWTFTRPDGEFGLHVGESAVFVWTNTYAMRYAECRGQQAMTSALCQSDKLPALTDDLDVLPLADSARVAAIRQRKA